MGFNEVIEKPIKVFCDNLGAQQLVKNFTLQNRSKHIEIKYHHVRELFQNQIIEVEYVPTNKMIADIMTKFLMKTKHEYFAKCLFSLKNI